MDIEQLKYPIGRYRQPEEILDGDNTRWIAEIADLPQQFRDTVKGLSEEQLSTPYRDGGWTVRQVIHHVPDSHMNAYVRFKLALTEDRPVIKPYKEDLWAELQDSRSTPVEVSLTTLDVLHKRWVALMRTMTAADFKRTYYHPHHDKEYTLESALALYAWHGKHHLAQIAALKERMKW